MANEWGPPIPGDEMTALKGRIDPAVWVMNGLGYTAQYGPWLNGRVFDQPLDFRIPANHPYYKVREYNAKYPDLPDLVLHDGSAGVPDDADRIGEVLVHWGDGEVEIFNFTEIRQWGPDPQGVGTRWAEVIAYTPKPKESEVTEQMPSDEAIEYVLKVAGYRKPDLALIKERAPKGEYKMILDHARLIQQYEPDRLKPAIDVAAEDAWDDLRQEDMTTRALGIALFKEGAAWQKDRLP